MTGHITQTPISKIIDTDYLDYAMYVLENRAVPSVIDGLKPVQRKLLYSMLNEYSGKKVKIAEFGGGLAKWNYHHGEVSAMSAAISMSREWSNNAPIFTGHGAFGSRMIQESAAPRYIYCSLSENFKKYFTDTEVAPEAFDKENPEPAFYLPTIPWVLVNGVSGLAVGFKTEILPRTPKDLVEAVKACLKNPAKFIEANEPIKPAFPHFRGEVIKHSENQWKTRGKIEYVGKNFFEISELPIGYDRETYVSLLNDMVDKDLIKDFDDACSGKGFGFKIKVSLAQKEAIEKDQFKYFKLEKIHTEILTTLGADGKLKIFQSVAELIAYFCDFRLTMFHAKIEHDRAQIRHEIERMTDKQKFISDVIDEEIPFKDTTKAEMLEYVRKWITENDYGKQFVNITLYECTSDHVLKLDSEIVCLKSNLVDLDSLAPEKLFQTRLNSLKV